MWRNGAPREPITARRRRAACAGLDQRRSAKPRRARTRACGARARSRAARRASVPDGRSPQQVAPSRVATIAAHARVVKDHAERVAPARAQPAHAVAHVDAVDAARAPAPAGDARRRRRRRPDASGTTSARDCMRGRCSVSTNSPPVKSRPGSRQQHRDLQRERHARRRDPDAGSCSRLRRTAAAAASAASAPPRGSAR